MLTGGAFSLTLACSSCFFGEEHVRWAYYISAMIMFALPVLMVFGTVYWYRKAARAAARAESDQS